MKRFFSKSSLGGDFVLTGTEHNHLANVLRTRAGENVVVCNGDEFDYIYEAAKISKTVAQMRFISRELNKANPKQRLIVYLAHISHEKIALVAQKLNELGVSRLVLFNSERCNFAKKSINTEKLNEIVRQSCKQCGTSIPMIVNGVLTFNEMLKNLESHEGQIIFANEICSDYSIGIEKWQGNLLVIGPEGGFTESESTTLCALKNVRSVSLGRRILRAETAAIAASGVMLANMGEM